MSGKPKIVIGKIVTDNALAYLKEHTDILLYWDRNELLTRETLLAHSKGVEGLLVPIKSLKIDGSLLDALGPSLRVVSSMSVGLDHVDVKACEDRKILVGNTPGVLDGATADIALLLMLGAARRVIESIDAVKEGQWGNYDPLWMCGHDLHGSTVGIVGMGRIGAAVARRLIGFDCKILCCSQSNKRKEGVPESVKYVSMDELLSQSDFISVHCPLTNDTKDLFNEAAFAKMKKTAIFINTSRGGVVDQEALIRALSNKVIAAAGLDVATPEPLPVDNPLLKMRNCFVLPHIGSATTQTRNDMGLLSAQNLVAGLRGERMPAQYKH